MENLRSDTYKSVFFGCTLAVSSMLLLLSFLQTNDLFAAVDIDVSEHGRAAAYDGASIWQQFF